MNIYTIHIQCCTNCLNYCELLQGRWHEDGYYDNTTVWRGSQVYHMINSHQCYYGLVKSLPCNHLECLQDFVNLCNPVSNGNSCKTQMVRSIMHHVVHLWTKLHIYTRIYNALIFNSCKLTKKYPNLHCCNVTL